MLATGSERRRKSNSLRAFASGGRLEGAMPVDEFEEILEEALLGDLALREGHCETETSEVAEQLESAASQLMQVPCAWSWKIHKADPVRKGWPQ